MRHALILAGGSGRRLWPESRRATPKQASSLVGGAPLLALAVERARTVAQEIWIAAGSEHLAVLRQILPSHPKDRWLPEKAAFDTAMAVGLALLSILHTDADAEVAILPADQIVADLSSFAADMDAAFHLAQGAPVVVLGVPPRSPETRFGYLEPGDPIEGGRGRRLLRYVEKPAEAEARTYVQAGWYWNAGIFVARAGVLLQAIGEAVRGAAELFGRLRHLVFTPTLQDEAADWLQGFHPVSLDRAVMEGLATSGCMALVEARFDWLDAGTWSALAELLPPDESGNATRGKVVALDTSGSLLVSAGEGLVATLGVHDLAVIQAAGVTLVCKKTYLDRLKDLLDRVKETHSEFL